MKKLISLLLLLPSLVFADVFVSVIGKPEVGLTIYPVTVRISESEYAFGLTFEREVNKAHFGIETAITNTVDGDRAIGLTGGNYITINPYAKIGSDKFIMFYLEESNTVSVKLGLNF